MSFSDEDTDIKALVSAWLKALPGSGSHEDGRPHSHSQLEGWLEDYFYRALEWVMKANDFVVDTTLVGVTMNGLSHLMGVSCKAEFVCALIRGLGGNLQPSTREKFAKEMFQWAHEAPPDSRRPLDTYYDPLSGRLSTFQLQVYYRDNCMLQLHVLIDALLSHSLHAHIYMHCIYTSMITNVYIHYTCIYLYYM